MSSLLYRCISPRPTFLWLPVASAQFFRHNGINLCYLDGSGQVTLAITATASLFGWVSVPQGRGNQAVSDDYWKSAGAGVDSVPVIPWYSNSEFLLPADDTATAAMAGNACDIIAVNDGTATTIDLATSSTDVMLIIRPGTDLSGGVAASVVVRINPAKRQADT